MEWYKPNCQEKPPAFYISAGILVKLAAAAVGADGRPQEAHPEAHQNGPIRIPTVGTAVWALPQELRERFCSTETHTESYSKGNN